MSPLDFEPCMLACYRCADACDLCAAFSLHETDPAPLARCFLLATDCAQVCRLAAACMARGSDVSGALCQLCADVCDACAEECVQHPRDHFQACANACEYCADQCRAMAARFVPGQARPGAQATHWAS